LKDAEEAKLEKERIEEAKKKDNPGRKSSKEH